LVFEVFHVGSADSVAADSTPGVASRRAVSWSAAGTHGLAVTDFNRDGILDLVATNAIANKASNQGNGAVIIFFNDTPFNGR